MRALVVFESVYGNTAAVARAVAEGLGDGAEVFSTDQITPEEASRADLLVLGAPVHGMTLPTGESHAKAVKNVGGDAVATDQRLMRDWLDELPAKDGLVAVFDTRVRGPLGRGGTTAIVRRLRAKQYREVTSAEGFKVILKTDKVAPGAGLLDGELERARRWGVQIREAAEAGSRG